MNHHMNGQTAALPIARGSRAFRIALILLPIGVLANIAYTLFATDRALLRSLGALPRGYLLVALALALTPWVTGTLRLWIWTRFLRYDVPLRDALRMTLAVDVGSAASPTAIGGEAFKWALLMQHGVRPGAAASLALLPKLEDGIFFLMALPVAVLWTGAWRLSPVLLSGRAVSQNVLVVLVVAGVLAFIGWAVAHVIMRGIAGDAAQRTGMKWWARTRRRLRRSAREARAVFGIILRRGKARLALTLSLTGIQWAARYSVISALALFLGVPFDPVLFWLLQWVVFTIMSFIPTPGAAGGAEVAFTAVYAGLLPGGTIGIATAAWRMFTFYVPVALAALFFTLLSRASRSSEPLQRANVRA